MILNYLNELKERFQFEKYFIYLSVMILIIILVKEGFLLICFLIIEIGNIKYSKNINI